MDLRRSNTVLSPFIVLLILFILEYRQLHDAVLLSRLRQSVPPRD